VTIRTGDQARRLLGAVSNPRLALFLIDRHRSRDVLVRVVGESFAGTLVSDFYAVYNGLECAKQRCLVYLLRELAKLREELPWQSVRAFIHLSSRLLRDLFQGPEDEVRRRRLDTEPLQFGRDLAAVVGGVVDQVP